MTIDVFDVPKNSQENLLAVWEELFFFIQVTYNSFISPERKRLFIHAT